MGDMWQGWQTAEERKTALVFTTPDGKSISQTSLRYHFKKVVEVIGIPSCRVHDLRHTFAVLSLQNRDDIKTVQGNLGHATAAFTLDVYGHMGTRSGADGISTEETAGISLGLEELMTAKNIPHFEKSTGYHIFMPIYCAISPRWRPEMPRW